MFYILILDLFSGGKSLSSALNNHEIITVDIENKYNPDICLDILWDDSIEIIKQKIGDRRIDFLWASPPCEKWSYACAVRGGNIYFESIKEKGKVVGIKPRENFNVKCCYKSIKNPIMVRSLAFEAVSILNKTFEIIQEFNPYVWVIENPVGYMQYYISRFNPKVNTATYCQYGFPYRKATHFFSNLDLNLKLCKSTDNCHENNFYNRNKGEKISNISIVNSYIDRSKIPPDLIKDIVEKGSEYIERR